MKQVMPAANTNSLNPFISCSSSFVDLLNGAVRRTTDSDVGEDLENAQQGRSN